LKKNPKNPNQKTQPDLIKAAETIIKRVDLKSFNQELQQHLQWLDSLSDLGKGFEKDGFTSVNEQQETDEEGLLSFLWNSVTWDEVEEES